MPAIMAPIVMSTLPARTALTVPEKLNPEISFNFVDGCDQIPLVQTSRVVDEDMPPPIMTIMNIDITVEPGNKYCTYRTQG